MDPSCCVCFCDFCLELRGLGGGLEGHRLFRLSLVDVRHLLHRALHICLLAGVSEYGSACLPRSCCAFVKVGVQAKLARIG